MNPDNKYGYVNVFVPPNSSPSFKRKYISQNVYQGGQGLELYYPSGDVLKSFIRKHNIKDIDKLIKGNKITGNVILDYENNTVKIVESDGTISVYGKRGLVKPSLKTQ